MEQQEKEDILSGLSEIRSYYEEGMIGLEPENFWFQVYEHLKAIAVDAYIRVYNS